MDCNKIIELENKIDILEYRIKELEKMLIKQKLEIKTEKIDIWDNACKIMKNELTDISYNTWIKTIIPISLSDNNLELKVKAEFNKGIIESRYIGLIKSALSLVSNKDYNIDIYVI